MPADIAHLPTALGSVVPTASFERNVCINSTLKFEYIYFFLLFFVYLRALHGNGVAAVAMHCHIHADVDTHTRVHGRRRNMLMLATARIFVVVHRIVIGCLSLGLRGRQQYLRMNRV